MNDLKKYILEQVKQILPSCDNLEGKATVSDTSYSIEFFAVINGKKMQCYELVDGGMIDESNLDHIFENIAGYIRSSHDYVKSELNKISF